MIEYIHSPSDGVVSQTVGQAGQSRTKKFTSVEDKAVDTNAGIVLDADALDTILHIGQSRETSHQPAVAKTTLLDVVSAEIGHEGRLLEDLVDSLDGLGNNGAGVEHGRHAEVVFGAS